MTQHELLSFVDFLHKAMKKEGFTVWPTRDLLLDNLEYNRQCWGPHWRGEYGDTARTLKRKHWLIEGMGRLGGCTSVDCHAVHVRLTDAGLKALQLMNENPKGCRSHIHVKRRERCHTQFQYQDRRAA